jgi:hypothetical protein
MLFMGDPVQPAAEAEQRARGPERVPDPVWQPDSSAAQPGRSSSSQGLASCRERPASRRRPPAVSAPELAANRQDVQAGNRPIRGGHRREANHGPDLEVGNNRGDHRHERHRLLEGMPAPG